MSINTNEDVAAKVRGVIAERRQKTADVSATLSLSKMSISRRMRGETPFTPEELIALSRLLDVPVAVFFGEAVPA